MHVPAFLFSPGMSKSDGTCSGSTYNREHIWLFYKIWHGDVDSFVCLRYKVDGGIMARMAHKGGLSTNRGLCTSYDAFWRVFLQTWFVNNKRRFVETKGGLSTNRDLSTNLLCEFGPKCFRVVRPSVRPVLVIALSQEPIDGFPPNLGHVCISQSQWTD